MFDTSNRCGPPSACSPPPLCGPLTPERTLQGSCGDDVVHISKADGLAGCLGLYKVSVNGESQYMTKQQLENTQFKLGAGDDLLLVDSDVDANIKADGGAGNDLLIGGGGNDTLDGGKGDDLIFGGAGDDKIKGGRGNDLIFGGSGNDKINGGRGNDVIFGGPGDDTIKGGKGRDLIFGGGLPLALLAQLWMA
jgi:Ca2+-binding RTX toxin-like protein